MADGRVDGSEQVAAPTRRRAPTPRPGPADPVTATPRRAPGSIRRTTTVDLARPEGLLGPVVVELRARDLRSAADGEAHEVDRFEARLVVDAATGRVVEAVGLAGEPVDALVDLGLRSGVGRQLAERYPDDVGSRRLRPSVLEDLGGAMLVSGYALLRGGAFRPSVEDAARAAELQADVCIGWATGSSMLESYLGNGIAPVPMGPAAPDLDHGDDPLAWHAVPALDEHTVRRRRRLDAVVLGDGRLRLDGHLRDSYRGDGGEWVMHEYTVEADVDADDRIVRLEATPRSLPWTECPGAAASVQRVVGTALADLPARARADLVGATTCTHLTSTVRTLADGALLGGPR